MYKRFFGLNENPFNVNPDPRYLYLTAQTREALDELTYGIQSRKGLILLTGEVGTGKTTLINRLLDWLRQQLTPTAFVFNSHLQASHLLDFILADFGVPCSPRLNGSALMRLRHWLIERYRAGDTPVLIVDEAQGLPTEVLEEIRLLLNLETPHEKLLQIVLAGQPELEERLKQPDLRQLKQRIMLRCKTAALTLDETHEYIHARLHIAGANGQPVFSSQAVNAVHFYSRGIPRVANLLCEQALIDAYASSVRPVPAHIIDEVAREFQLDDITLLTPSINCGVELGTGMIAAQSALATEYAPRAAGAESIVREAPGVMAGCVSRPYLVADSMHVRVQALGNQVSACEMSPPHPGGQSLGVLASVMNSPEPGCSEIRISSRPAASDSEGALERNMELAMQQLASAFSPLPHVVKAKQKLEASPISRHSPEVSSRKFAHLSTMVHAKAAPLSSVYLRLLGHCHSLAYGSARRVEHLVSAARSLPWRQSTALSRSRLQHFLQSVAALRRWRPAQRTALPSMLDPNEWLRRKANLYEWLRQPFDPMQLLLSYSWIFEARRRLGQKRT